MVVTNTGFGLGPLGRMLRTYRGRVMCLWNQEPTAEGGCGTSRSNICVIVFSLAQGLAQNI